MQVKLSFRYGIVTGLIIIFALLVSYFSITNKLTEIVSTATKKELQRDLLLNKQMLEQKPKGWTTSANTNAWIKQIGRTLDIRVTLIDLDGRLLSDSSVPQEKLSTVENHLQRSEVKAALEKGYGENTRFSHTVKEYSLYMAVPVGIPEPCAILRFSKPIYDIELFEGGVDKEIDQGLLLPLMLSITTGFFASFLLAHPLRTLAETIKHNKDGDFSGATSLLHRQDEIGSYARAITRMADEITTMRRSEEWYQAVFSGIREAIIVTDASGDIILVNPAASRMFRIEGTMFKSRPIRQLSDNKLQELFARVHSTHITLRKEEMSLMTTKGDRIMQISSMPLTKENRFEGSVFVLNDITKLRNLEKIRSDFVASVSHELRTPLTVISGYTETLLEGAMDDPKHATPFLNIILQASKQLTALVNDVLDLSKIESGYIDYQFGPVDLADVLMKSVDLLKPSLEKKQIRLDIKITEELPPVYADARYLDIVIRNLLDNAIKYVDNSNGRIRITAFGSDDDVRLEIDDNGIGIAKQDLGRIFERFYRVDKARSRQHGGTGLGLSIVKHIVLAHKGDIEVRSRLNHGSVFSVVLRRARENG
ncbi:MAG: PAS domain S-box protein [Chlorobium sp.]|nr:MAG: PAS domain S-box protein [Chlorobium sp.]